MKLTPLLGLLLGCGGHVGDTHDAGAMDATVMDTAADEPATPSCAPATDPFLPSALPTPTGAHLGQCDPYSLDAYTKCMFGGSASACAMLDCGGCTSGVKDCIDCAEWWASDVKWGPVIYDKPPFHTLQSTYRLNIEGCLNLATGESGPQSLGQLLYDFNRCQDYACRTHEGDEACFSECKAGARSGMCKPYGDSYATALGAANSPDLVNCLPQSGETDLKPLGVRMVTYFCGP